MKHERLFLTAAVLVLTAIMGVFNATPAIAKGVADEECVYTSYVRGEIHVATKEEGMYLFLVDVGLSDAGSAGVMGNLYAEVGKGLNPETTSSAGYYGLAQWSPSRKKDLVSWCAQNGLDAAGAQGQLSFIVYDVEENYPELYEYLTTCDSPEDAAQEFAAVYERCVGRTGHGDGTYSGCLLKGQRGRTYQALAKREQKAKEYFDRYSKE